MHDPRPEAADDAAREQMISDQLAARGIRSAAVLAAIRRVPRERFVPTELRNEAYADKALPIACHQTISQPYMVALMSEALLIGPHARVLEVGTGSGYQTAVLSHLAREVFTIEWHLGLMTAASDRLQELGLRNVQFRCGDGSLGWPEHQPYDGIIVTAGAPEVPPTLCAQLAPGATLVVPIGPQDDQTLVRVRRTEAGFERRELIKCRFVRLVGAEGWRD